MSSRASLLFLSLLAGAAIASPSFAATDASDAVQVAASQEATAKFAEAAPKAKAERVQVADAAAAQAKAKAKAKAKAAKAQEAKPDRYTQERDKGLDVAAKYAPKSIEKVRKNGYLEKGDTAGSGSKGGWRSIVDKYTKGR